MYDVLKDRSQWQPFAYTLGAYLVMVAVAFLVRHVGLRARVRPKVRQDRSPRPVKVLVVFLSNPAFGSSSVPEVVGRQVETRAESIDDVSFLGRLNWRMPCEAVRHHLEALERLIVIPSADTKVWVCEAPAGRQGPSPPSAGDAADKPMAVCSTQKGSYVLLPEFEALLDSLLPEGTEITVQSLGDLAVSEYALGVDFEDTERLVEALERVYDRLYALEYSDDQILVDVTGGQKPTTVAGAAVALAQGRRFQYVSMHDYKVMTYDVTYGMDE